MTENIHGLRTLALYNIGVPLAEPTAEEAITESVAMGGVLVGGIKTLQYGYKGAKWMMHPVDNTRIAIQNHQINSAVKKRIKGANPIGFGRAKEYSAYKKLKGMSKTMPKKPVSVAGKTAQFVVSEVANGRGKQSYRSILSQVEHLNAQEELASYRQKVAGQRRAGSLTRMLKDKTGLTKLAKQSKSLATQSLKYGKFIKCAKGNGLAAIAFTGIGVFTEIIPAFRVSTEAGLKQIGKTAAKTSVDIAAFAAGGWAGAKIGAGIGTALGSVVPGIGNGVGGAIGTVLGFVAGCAASYFADEQMEKLLGKNEAEKAQDEQAETTAQRADQDPQKMMMVVKRASRKLVDSFYENGGDLTEDDMIAAKELGIDLDNEWALTYFVYANNPQRYAKFMKECYPNGKIEETVLDEQGNEVKVVYKVNDILQGLKSVYDQEQKSLRQAEQEYDAQQSQQQSSNAKDQKTVYNYGQKRISYVA